MKTIKVFDEHQGHELHVIPPTSPHPDFEVGIGLVGNGTALRVYLSRDEAREIAKAILAAAGKPR